MVKTSRVVSTSTENLSGGPGAEGWDRLFVTIDASAGNPVLVELVCNASSGTVYFACPQLEEGSIPNRVNFFLNADFRRTSTNTANADHDREFPDNWTKESGVSTAYRNRVILASEMDLELPEGVKGNALQLYSRPHRTSVAFGQIVYMKGVKGDVYVVGGWANGNSVAKIPGSSRKTAPCIAYRYIKSDGSTTSWKYAQFSHERCGWQFGCWPIVADVAHEKIEFHVNYSRNAQTCRFTNLFLYKEQFGDTFTYDDNKNVTSVANLSETQSNMKYDSFDNLTSYVQPGGADSEKYTMTYGSTDAEKKKHLLRTSTTPMGVKQTFDYDAKGNQTLAATVGTIDSTEYSIKTKTEYTSDGNYPLKSYDARGYTVTRNWNPVDFTLSSTIDPDGQAINYLYDASKRIKKASITAGNSTYLNEYTHSLDRLATIRHNTSSDSSSDVVYTFDYDSLGRNTKAMIGNKALYTNVYSNDRNGILKEIRYDNGGKVVYEHDDFDRLIGVKYEGDTSNRFAYEYGANGQSSILKDTSLRRIYQTEYDLAERPCQSTQRDLDADNLIYRSTLTYDGKNRLNAFEESLPGESHKTTYTYDTDNRATGIQFNDAAHVASYSYDALGRPVGHAVTNGTNTYSTAYTYAGGNTTLYGTGATTHLVETINQGSGNNAINFAYEYDKFGNIESETRNSKTIGYAYDALGQLVRVNDPHENKTWVYEYDLGGNIKCKKRYAYTSAATPTSLESTINYTYGDANWKDKLTAYNGNTIAYDVVGNVINDGSWTYEWQAGHLLKKMTSANKTVEFKYNAKGLRVQKKVTAGGIVTTTDYILHGRRIMHQKITVADVNGNASVKEMHFFYGDDGRPAMVKHNNAYYTYVFNLQGDIVGIVDASGNLVVEYKYGAWGKRVAAITSAGYAELESLNPFGYRGHVWDAETGLYYMHTRYYSPDYCRFISPDKIKYLGADGNILGYNAYIYCNNNPVNMCDAAGEFPVFATLKLALKVVSPWLKKVGTAIALDVGVAMVVDELADEEYTWKDLGATTVNALLPEKPLITAIEVVHSGYSTYKDSISEGMSVDAALQCGLLSAASSALSWENVAKFFNVPPSIIKEWEIWGNVFYESSEGICVALAKDSIKATSNTKKATSQNLNTVERPKDTLSSNGGARAHRVAETR